VAVAAYLQDAARGDKRTAGIVLCGRNVSPEALSKLR
jgi:hypothetical protein